MKSEHYPNSIYAYENGISLPSFPALKEEEMAYVCSVIEAYYGK
jgi:dTDP-4-amino-4,6-dideoxygalactose transaminase